MLALLCGSALMSLRAFVLAPSHACVPMGLHALVLAPFCAYVLFFASPLPLCACSFVHMFVAHVPLHF